MRNYQRTKNNPYRLPDYLYRRILYLVKDYDRLKAEWEDIIHETPSNDGMPRGTDISDPTFNKVVRREKLRGQMEAVEQGLMAIPFEYRRGVLSHVKYGEMFPDYGDRKTWFSYQSRFLFYVAKRLGEI